MCNRQKPVTREEIDQIKIQLENRTASLKRLTKKLETEGWTKDDKELADEHVRYIKENAPIYKAYFRPAIVFAD